jgi:hypothetical protein
MEKDCTPIDAERALDNLARFVQVIGRDRKLTEWFHGLESMDPVRRGHEILILAERIGSGHKDPGLIASFKLLADQAVFDAARTALRNANGD